MFICAITGKPSRRAFFTIDEKGDAMYHPAEKAHKIVLATRHKVYPARPNREDREAGRYPYPDGSEDPGGEGWEIVREVLATAEGVQLWESMKECGGTPDEIIARIRKALN